MQELQEFKCFTVTCRVTGFKGVMLMPLNNCPGCGNVGVLVALPESAKEDNVSTD